MPENIAILGSGGAIGAAFAERLRRDKPSAVIHKFSASLTTDKNTHPMRYDDEASVQQASETAAQEAALDMVLVATGLLHDENITPEKSLRDLSAEKFHRLFAANVITPALAAKHFLPKMRRDGRAVFAALSARVGSISDNRIGGWYAYRASKAALNMVIKNAAIEVARSHKNIIIVGLHPGTVNSDLSRPFQSQVPPERLFTPQYAAEKLLAVLAQLQPQDSGKCFAWDGKEINP